jgi:hypothetical protein
MFNFIQKVLNSGYMNGTIALLEPANQFLFFIQNAVVGNYRLNVFLCVPTPAATDFRKTSVAYCQSVQSPTSSGITNVVIPLLFPVDPSKVIWLACNGNVELNGQSPFMYVVGVDQPSMTTVRIVTNNGISGPAVFNIFAFWINTPKGSFTLQ